MSSDALAFRLERIWAEAPGLVGWLTTVNHKRIGKRYFVTASAFFLAAGVEALLMRTQLARANASVVSAETFSELFSMHGVTMIFLFVTPMLSGAFGNYLVPLMIGARDMAFPRMNALSYWIYLAAGVFIYSSLLIGQAPTVGWFAYVPLAEKDFTPNLGSDFYNLGLVFLTISTTVGATNFVVTIFRLRAPGMSLSRLPLFCWAILATSFAQIFALPALTAANVLAELDRKLDFHFFDPSRGGDTLLYQHLFWIFGHPDVYIIFLPAVGIVSSIVPVFSRRPMVAHTYLAAATMLTALIGFGVWVHHMFATGLPQLTLMFFSAASMMVVIPSGIQVFGWCATLIRGRPRLDAPLLYVLGFLVVFVVGGLTGIMFAAIPFDQQVTDSYFVVAHFHYVLFGGAVFPLFAGLHYWFPKVTGRMYGERVARIAFWLFFLGFNLTFFPMHIAGLLGMPRRVYTYPDGLGWQPYNLASTIGAFLLAAGIVLAVGNLAAGRARGPRASADPWYGNTLEWATASPPPEYNFERIPEVRGLNPNWEHPHGELALTGGHETPGTTVLDGELEEVLEMPGETAVPLALALSLAAVFTSLLLGHYLLAAGCAGVVGLVLTYWHSHESPGPSPNGWWGTAMLVATEGALFGCLVAGYFYLEFKASHWPPQGVEKPALWLPGLLTGILVLTSVPMQVASRAATAGRAGLARGALLLALAVQCGYLGVQIVRFAHGLDRFQPHESAYGSFFYTLLGAHHVHVLAGIAAVAFLLFRLTRGVTPYRAAGVRCAALYWHFVNGLAVVVYLTLSSPSL